MLMTSLPLFTPIMSFDAIKAITYKSIRFCFVFSSRTEIITFHDYQKDYTDKVSPISSSGWTLATQIHIERKTRDANNEM